MATFQRPKFEQQEYVLREDTDLDEQYQTKWAIRPLTQSEIFDGIDAQEKRGSASAAKKAFTIGCIGWTNLMCDGQPFVFEGITQPGEKTARAKRELVDQLKPAWVIEIGQRIIEISTLSDSEKN